MHKSCRKPSTKPIELSLYNGSNRVFINPMARQTCDRKRAVNQAVPIILLLGCVGFPGSGFGDVVVGPKISVISPPPSIQLNQLQSNTDLFLFQEKSDFVLPTDIHVDATAPGLYNFYPPPGGTISAGTEINSYLIHDDPINIELFLNRQISFTHGETILGIEMLSSTLDASDPLLEAAGTLYPPSPIHWGLELGLEPDSIRWTGETIIWNTLTGAGFDTGGEDNIRIITSITMPEPSYVPVLGLLFALVLAERFRSSVPDANPFTDDRGSDRSH